MQKYLQLLTRLWKLLSPFHKDFYLQLVSTILQQGIYIYTIYLTAQVLQSIVTGNTTQGFYYTLYGLACALIRVAISYVTEIHAQNNIDFAIQQHLEEYSFKKIFKLTISQYTEDHSAVKEQVINRGENAIESIISTLVLNVIPTVTQILFALIAIAFYSKAIAFWTLFTLIVAIYWSNYFANHHRPFIKKDINNWDTQKKIRSESFQHLGLIRTLGAEKFYLKKYLHNRQSFLDYKKYVWNMSIAHGNKRFSFFTLSRAISSLGILYLASFGSITAGAIYAIWSYIGEANGQIFTVIKALRQMPLRFTELEKYISIVDKEPSFNEEGSESPLSGDIVFKDISFSYPHGNTSLFKNVSLIIPSGQKTAFVGSSGSGKSTIIKLLLRSYDYKEGSITIGGNELSTIDATYLRNNLGYVEQHVELFDETIKENILMGVDSSTRKKYEENLEEVAQQTRITEFYHRLGEAKFETYIGERGVKLSGGERQRIGIARAIIKNPDILIFDEATSALDTENEAKVMEAINEVSQGKTTIIIAHRLSTVRDADKIIVMHKGSVVGDGTHDTLMQTNTFYQNLVMRQLSK
jgi:ABC-type multidrug transport system fused ATPase/permease subunit